MAVYTQVSDEALAEFLSAYDLGAAGVLFTIDTESGHPDVVFITGAWGLGENVVQGAVDPVGTARQIRKILAKGDRASGRGALGLA